MKKYDTRDDVPFLAGERDEPTARLVPSARRAIGDNYWQTNPVSDPDRLPRVEDTMRKFGSPSFAATATTSS